VEDFYDSLLAQGAEVPLGLLQLRLDPPLVPAQEGGHDLTTPRGPVPALSLAELRAMEPWVPTLEEVLELFQDYPEAVLNAELKSLPGFPSAARALGRALTPLASRALVSSFDPVALYLLRDSGLPRALLFAEEDLGPVARALGLEGCTPTRPW
jgi:glycerophosphoryl diester phosphodiesterase